MRQTVPKIMQGYHPREALRTLPPNISGPLEQQARPLVDRLAPHIEDAAVVFTHAHDVLAKESMTIEDAREAVKMPLTAEVLMDPDQERRVELGVQLRHVEQVIGTSLALKSSLIAIGAPERIYGYMKGTGLPVPKETENFRRVTQIPYGGDGPLKYFPRPTVAGHKGILSVYVARAENGKQATWLIHEGRDHAYSKSNLLWLNHKLALVPRVLRGIADGVVTTFATGFDGVITSGESPFQVGDIGIMISNSDLTSWGAFTDPGGGDQTIVRGIFGGEFQPGVQTMKPNFELIAPFVSGFAQAVNENATQDENPHLHLAHLYDCNSVPNFENEIDTAVARVISEEVREMGAVPQQYYDLVLRSPIFMANPVGHVNKKQRIPIAISHGMATRPEIAGYAQADNGLEKGVDTAYRKRLPFIALVGCTDIVDPRPDGASYATSHANILKAIERYDRYLAPALTNFFLQITAEPTRITR